MTSFVHYAMRFTNIAKVAIYLSFLITLFSPFFSPPFVSFSCSQVNLVFKNTIAVLNIRIGSLKQNLFSVKNLGNASLSFIKPSQTNNRF